MPRRPIPIVPGVPHHITQRAAHGRRILESDDAKAVLANLLADWAERTGVVVHAYAFMNNHIHLSATPPEERSLARMLGNATQGFSRWTNVCLGDIGPNWQRRFFAAPMDGAHAIAAARYIERNPVAAGLVEHAWEWPWSSAAFHVGAGPRPRLLNAPEAVPAPVSRGDWRAMLEEPVDGLIARSVHRASSGATVLACEDWIDRIEAKLGRRIRPRPRGRPALAIAGGPGADRSWGDPREEKG